MVVADHIDKADAFGVYQALTIARFISGEGFSKCSAGWHRLTNSVVLRLDVLADGAEPR